MTIKGSVIFCCGQQVTAIKRLTGDGEYPIIYRWACGYCGTTELISVPPRSFIPDAHAMMMDLHDRLPPLERRLEWGDDYWAAEDLKSKGSKK